MKEDTKRDIERVYGVRFGTFNYTVNIDERKKIAYFETPKVACTSIKKYMMDSYDWVPVELPSKGAVHDRATSPLAQLSDLSDDAAFEIFGDRFQRFTFVRNPYTRALSAYLDKIVTNEWERRRHLPQLGFGLDERPSFAQFLESIAKIDDRLRDIHYMTQARLTGQINGLPLTFVGRFERFASDFSRLKATLFNDDSKDDYASFGKHHASNAGAHIAKYLGPEEQSKVRDIYAIDFIAFGYDFDLNQNIGSAVS